jgi:hypothetical protein
MDDNQLSELIRLRHAVNAMREYISQNLNALDATIDRLLPKESTPTEPQNFDLATVRAWCKDSIRSASTNKK